MEEEFMDKSLAIIIKETKTRLVDICNESKLPPAILDLIVESIYTEIHSLVERQLLNDEISYIKTVKNTEKESEDNF